MQKHVYEIQQTVFENPADSFKLAWFTLPDSFKITRNPCQIVLIYFGFLFTPVTDNSLKGMQYRCWNREDLFFYQNYASKRGNAQRR